MSDAMLSDRHQGTPADVALSANDPFDNFVSIEGIAVQFGILQVELPRETCTADSEALVRLLGRAPQSQSPWLPIASLGPLLILAHHNPKCSDNWGIPDFLTVKVAISPEQYETLRRDMVRIANC